MGGLFRGDFTAGGFFPGGFYRGDFFPDTDVVMSIVSTFIAILTSPFVGLHCKDLRSGGTPGQGSRVLKVAREARPPAREV